MSTPGGDQEKLFCRRRNVEIRMGRIQGTAELKELLWLMPGGDGHVLHLELLLGCGRREQRSFFSCRLSRSRHVWLKADAPGWRSQPAAASQG